MIRVLVLSRNSVTRALLVSVLPAESFHVTPVDSLPRALAMGEAARCDAVLLHAEIARASPDVVDRLREGLGEVPLIVLDRSYADERRGIEEARAFGAVAFLPLPPDAATLAEVLRSAHAGTMPRASSSRFAAADPAESNARDAEQTARYVERLWSRLADLDAYQLLRVAPDASEQEIQQAFRQRALEFHPDRQFNVLDEETRERVYQIFKRVSRAFREIGEPSARRAYDAQRKGDGR